MTVAIEPITCEEVKALFSQDELSNLDKRCLVRCANSATPLLAGIVDGEVVCIIGMIPPTIIADYAYLWMNVTDKLAGNEFIFVRHSQMAIEEALKRYKYVVGHCELHNKYARKGLKGVAPKL